MKGYLKNALLNLNQKQNKREQKWNCYRFTPVHYVIFGSQNGAKNRENSLFNLIFLTILTYKAPIWDHKTTVQF